MFDPSLEQSSSAPSAPPSPAAPARTAAAALFWSVALAGIVPFLAARDRMGPAVSAAVAWHIVGGLASLGLGCWVLGIGARRSRYPSSLIPHPSSLIPPLALLAGLTGLLLTAWAAAGQGVGRIAWAYWLHVAAGFALALWAAWTLVHRARLRPRRAPASATGAAVLLVLSGCGLAAYAYQPEACFRALTATTATQAGSPLFPAGARGDTGPAWPASDAIRNPQSAIRNECASPGCHPAQAAAWAQSAHARAASSPFYRTAFAQAARDLGPDGAAWCAGCHDPVAVLRAGSAARWAALHDSAAPDGGGVGCLACHAMRGVPMLTGGGHAVYAVPPDYPFAGSEVGARRWVHDALLRVRPAPHVAGMSGPPGGRGPAMCEPCHRLGVTVAQNAYKHMAYDDTWDTWQSGPWSGESLHAFGGMSAGRTRDCAGCHMAPTRGGGTGNAITAHACPASPPPAAPGKSAPSPPPLRVDIFAARGSGGPSGGGARPLFAAPLSDTHVAAQARLAPGAPTLLDVVVENTAVGHAFPSGVPDMRDVWLEVAATNDSGIADCGLRIADYTSARHAHSSTPNTQHLIPNTDRRTSAVRSAIRNPQSAIRNSAHSYGALLLDRAGRPTSEGRFYAGVAEVWRREVAPGEADVARYRLVLPRATGAAVRVTARLMMRPAKPAFAAEAGGSVGEDAPRVLASSVVTLRVGAGVSGGDAPALGADPGDARRFYAYGVGLFRQGDLAGARASFAQAGRLAPHGEEWLLGLARVYLEGDLLSARLILERDLKERPGSPRAQAWLGRCMRRMGQLDRALALLEPLAERFPRDRELWDDIGLCRLQQLQYDRAAQAFTRLLAIAPDDAGGHYNLMKCWLGLRRLADARREEAIFHNLQDAEPLTALLDDWSRRHPEARQEPLPLHEHALEVAQ